MAPLLAVAAAVLALGWWWAPGDAPHPPPPATSASPAGMSQDAPGTGSTPARPARAPGARDAVDALRDPRVDPAAVLAAWDAARARAYARGSSGALARLYLSGSLAGRRDVRLLAAYAARGLRVRDMRMEVSGFAVVRARERTRVLRVTDRLVGARAVRADGTSYPLPRDRPSTRVVRMVHHGGAWRVAAVGPAG